MEEQENPVLTQLLDDCGEAQSGGRMMILLMMLDKYSEAMESVHRLLKAYRGGITEHRVPLTHYGFEQFTEIAQNPTLNNAICWRVEQAIGKGYRLTFGQNGYIRILPPR